MRAALLALFAASALAGPEPRGEVRAVVGKCQGGLRPSVRCSTCQTCAYCGKTKGRESNSATCAVCEAARAK